MYVDFIYLFYSLFSYQSGCPNDDEDNENDEANAETVINNMVYYSSP